MCGRFTLHAKAEELESVFQLGLGGFRVEARYNIAPGQWIFVVRPTRNGDPAPALARWGLVPTWAKDPASGPRPINARAEGIADKPTFRGAFRHGRCLIPASGFYEWKTVGGKKHPIYIRPTEGPIFAFAGLFSDWAGPDGELPTCTIITTEANETVAGIHHRMPVILPPEAWGPWLDPANYDTKRLISLLCPCPCPSGSLTTTPVGPAVSNPQNDGPELIRGVAPELPTLF